MLNDLSILNGSHFMADFVRLVMTEINRNPYIFENKAFFSFILATAPLFSADISPRRLIFGTELDFSEF